MYNFLHHNRVLWLTNGTSSTATITDVIDMLGYEGVVFAALIGKVDTSTCKGIHIEGGASSGGGDAVDLEGSEVLSSSTGTDIVIMCEINKPLTRYVRGVLESTGGTTTWHDIIAIQYGLRKLPEAQTTAYGHETEFEVKISPSSGTA